MVARSDWRQCLPVPSQGAGPALSDGGSIRRRPATLPVALLAGAGTETEARPRWSAAFRLGRPPGGWPRRANEAGRRVTGAANRSVAAATTRPGGGAHETTRPASVGSARAAQPAAGPRQNAAAVRYSAGPILAGGPFRQDMAARSRRDISRPHLVAARPRSRSTDRASSSGRTPGERQQS